MTILEQMATSAAFVPSTTMEYFALQLAKRLEDTGDIHWYLRSVDHFSRGKLLSIFHSVQSVAPAGRSAAFRTSLHH